jgi:hypothetical protein
VEPYLFQGVVLPERAQLSLSTAIGVIGETSDQYVEARISILLNQVAVWVDTEVEWDILDLRNTVRGVLQNELAIVGYLKGLAYDVEVRRVLNRGLGIDHVFGIEIPCIARRTTGLADPAPVLDEIRRKTVGPNGHLLYRCLNDLCSAMKHPEDTGFYCYRAVEALRLHCALSHDVAGHSKAAQWEKFHAICQVSEDDLMFLKRAADPVRHGDVVSITSAERAGLFTRTWDVVDAYLKQFEPEVAEESREEPNQEGIAAQFAFGTPTEGPEPADKVNA